MNVEIYIQSSDCHDQIAQQTTSGQLRKYKISWTLSTVPGQIYTAESENEDRICPSIDFNKLRPIY